MDVGINTQNLVAILLVIFLSVVNIFGVKTGALIQNVFTAAKVAALLGLAFLGLALGRNAQALAANFSGHFWRNAGLGAQHAVQVGVGGPIVMVGTLTILAVAQVGSLFSADAWNNVTFTAGEVKNPSRNLPLSLALGTGVVIALYIACNFIYLSALPLDGAPGAATILARGIKYAAEDRVGTAVMTQMFGAAGGLLMAAAIMISELRLQQWPDSFRGARLLRHGEGWPVLPQRGQAASDVQDAGGFADGADGVGVPALHLGQLRAASRLHYLCRAGLLHSDDCGIVCAAAHASGCAAAVPGRGLSGAAARFIL